MKVGTRCSYVKLIKWSSFQEYVVRGARRDPLFGRGAEWECGVGQFYVRQSLVRVLTWHLSVQRDQIFSGGTLRRNESRCRVLVPSLSVGFGMRNRVSSGSGTLILPPPLILISLGSTDHSLVDFFPTLL